MPDKIIENLGGRMAKTPTIVTPSLGDIPTSHSGEGDLLSNFVKKVTNTGIKDTSKYSIPGEQADFSGRYSTVYQNIDNEDAYARGQSTLDKIGNGIAKFAGVTTQTVLNNTVGMVYGIGAAIGNQKMSSLFDNSWYDRMDEISKKMENALPHYKTEAETRDPLSFSSVFTTNFVMDSIFKNLGYAVGAAVSGIGASAALEALQLSKGLVLGGKWLQALEATETAIQEGKGVSNMIGALKKAATSPLSKFGGLIEEAGAVAQGAKYSTANRILSSAFSSIGEASMEGYGSTKQFRDNAIAEYTRLYGTAPTGIDLEEINNYATKVGNSTFGLNLALLTATQYIQLPKIFASTYTGEKKILNDLIFKKGEWKSTLPEAGIGKMLYKAKNIGSLFFSKTEAFEEGAQFAIQQGTNNYFNKKYLDGDAPSFWEDMAGLMTPFGEGVLGEGVKEALTTDEGLQNILIGGLSGAMMTSGVIGVKDGRLAIGKSGKIGERGFTGYGGEKAEMIEKVTEAWNSSTLSSKMKDMANSIKISQKVQETREAKIRQGDILEAKDLESDYMLSFLLPRIKYGGKVAIDTEINDVREQASTQEGFLALQESGYANENDTRETFLSRLSNIERTSKAVYNSYNSLQQIYAGAIKYDKDGQPILKDGVPQKQFSDSVIDKMVYATLKVHDYNTRIPQLSSTLSAANIPILGAIGANNTIDYDVVKASLQSIDEADLTVIEKNQLKQSLQDMLELSLRKELYKKELDSMAENPDKWTDIEEDDSLSLNTRKADGTFTSSDIKIGQEFSTGPSMIVNGKLVLSPKMVVLSKSLTSQYQVKKPDGTISFARPKDFKNFNVSESNVDITPIIDANIPEDIRSLSLEEKLNYINDLLPEDIRNIDTQIKEYVKKVTKEVNEINDQKQTTLQTELDKESGTPNSATFTGFTYKKANLANFLSKEADFYDKEDENNNLPFQKRRLHFIDYLSKIRNTPAFANYKVLAITASNEEEYGLKGLTDYVISQSKESIDNVIIKLYILKKDNSLYLTSQEGAAITKLEGNILEQAINEGIFGVFHSDIAGTYKMGEKAGAQSFSGEYTEEDVEAIDKQLKAWREKTLSSTESPIYNIEGVSKGISITDEEEKSVIEAGLINEDDLEIPDILRVLTLPNSLTDSLGNVINIPVGVPIIVNGENIEKLNNRKFTKKEAENLFSLLKEYVKRANSSENTEEIGKYLRGIIYFSSPKDNISPNQIWYADKKMFFSTNFSVPFTATSLEENKEQIVSHLEGIYNNVNHVYLKRNAPFTELSFENGRIISTEHPNYQTFLLTGSSPYLTTRLRPVDNITNRPNKISRYTTLSYNEEFNYSAIPTKQEEKPITKPTTPKQSSTNPFDNIKKRSSEGVSKENQAAAFFGEATPSVPSSNPFDNMKKRSTEGVSKEEEAAAFAGTSKKKTPPSYPEFKLATPIEDYSVEKLQEVKDYIEKNTPFSFSLLSNILQTPDGLYAWGSYKDMVISLYEKAIQGTGYHEVFEGVFKTFLSPQERQNIFKDFTSRKGSFIHFNGTEYQAVNYSDATFFQAKEALADEFADYVLTQKTVDTDNAIVRFFKNILAFIKYIVTGDVQRIDNLFKKIDAGQYKTPKTTYLSSTEKEEYKIADLDYTQQHEVIRGVAMEIIQAISSEGVSFTEFEESEEFEISVDAAYDKVYDRLQSLFTEELDNFTTNKELQKAYLNMWEGISKDWEQVKTLTNEYLKTFSIIVTEDILDKNNYNKEYIGEEAYFQNDAKNTASRSIKLLMATLPETIFTNRINKVTGMPEIMSDRSRATLLQRQVNYSKEFNNLLYNMVKVNSYQEKMDMLKEMAKTQPNYQRLFQRLQYSTNNPLNDWKLKIRWFTVMSKQEPKVFTEFIKGDRSDIGESDQSSSIKTTSQRWVDTMKEKAIRKDKHFFTNENNEFVLSTIGLSNDISTPTKKLAYLQSIGIDFTMISYKALSFKDKKRFDENVAGIQFQLSKRPQFVIDNTRSLELVANIDNLADLYIKSGNDSSSTLFSIEGKLRTKYVSSNIISRNINDINNAETREELIERMPQLSSVTDSIYLNEVLFTNKGNKKNIPLSIGYFEGTKEGDIVTTVTNMPQHKRMMAEINQNLEGNYYMLPADSSTQWLVEMFNPISFDNIDMAKVRAIFTNYYKTEKEQYARIDAKERDKRATIFKTLSKDYSVSDEEIGGVIEEFLLSQASLQRRVLESFDIIQERDGNYKFKGLTNSFVNKHLKGSKLFKSTTIDKILLYRVINQAINTVEQQRLFFGNILSYKDPTKRYKLFLSPREAAVYGVQDYNDYLNNFMNMSQGVRLSSPLLGKHTFSDNMATVKMADLKTSSPALEEISSKYAQSNSADAQAYSTLVAFRERRLKEGTWTDKMNEQYEYSQARDRQMLLEDGYLTNDTYPLNLQRLDKETISFPAPNIGNFWVEKPVVAGFDTNNELVVDKFSIVSFSYASVRNTNFRDHYIKMLSNNIGYIVTESGRKVGDNTLNSFYNEDGTVNTSPYEGVTQVPFKSFGTQTDTSSLKESQTRGTQVTKLVLANLYDNGKPISEEADVLSQENISLLREQVKLGYEKLLDMFGAEEVNGQYRIQDKRKIVKLIKNELLRREVIEPIKALLSTTDNNQLTVAFESLPIFSQIKSILYSYVDKQITSPKVTGGPKVQVSGILMEEYGAKRTKKDGVFVSEGLKFYTKEEPWCEVMIGASHYAKVARDLKVPFSTEQELFDLFDKGSLRGIGFRIPTQDTNSIENFKIVGFLPESMGDVIIVPEEIVTKAGSDFDIDKLNTYLRSFYKDANGKIKEIPYFGTGEEGFAKMKNFFSRDATIDFSLDIVRANANALDEVDFEKSEKDSMKALRKLFLLSIENGYYKNMQDILEMPYSFERLVSPNTDEVLKGHRDMLTSLAPKQFNNYTTDSIIDSMYMLNLRHQALSTIGLIGIAAVAQTGTVLNQIANVHIDVSKIPSLSYREKKYIGNGSILLPHKTNDQGMPSLSSIKDLDGEYITSKISQFINGTVDVFKDAYLSQINFNSRTASTYLLLERLGVPDSKKNPIVTLFMNQPIIRELMKELDRNAPNTRSVLHEPSLQAIKAKFAAQKTQTALPKDLVASLKDNISSYYSSSFLKSKNAEQQLILSEFLKYAVMADNLFRFQQGVNWDTTSILDNNSLFFKEQQLQRADNTIISSPSSLLSSTFIGEQRKAIVDTTNVLSDVFLMENPIVKEYMEDILTNISEQYISLEEKNILAKKAEESLLNYLIQVKLGINTTLYSNMVDSNTALVNELKDLKKTLIKEEQTIGSNIVLQHLFPMMRKTTLSTKNIRFATIPKDIYTKNLYNSAFEELLNHPLTQEFAKKLIILSFQQSGVSSSFLSIKDLIPARAYSHLVNKVIGSLVDRGVLGSFRETGSYYRNNTDSLPEVSEYSQLLPSQDTSFGMRLNVLETRASSPYVIHNQVVDEGTDQERVIKRLFRRIEDVTGTPVYRKIEIVNAFGQRKTQNSLLYQQINAWGDGQRAQEHYSTVRPSVFFTEFQKVPDEQDILDMYGYVTAPIAPFPKQDLTIEDKNCN